MVESDDKALCSVSDEELLMLGVIKGDHELLFLDSYLGEILRS